MRTTVGRFWVGQEGEGHIESSGEKIGDSVYHRFQGLEDTPSGSQTSDLDAVLEWIVVTYCPRLHRS